MLNRTKQADILSCIIIVSDIYREQATNLKANFIDSSVNLPLFGTLVEPIKVGMRVTFGRLTKARKVLTTGVHHQGLGLPVNLPGPEQERQVESNYGCQLGR